MSDDTSRDRRTGEDAQRGEGQTAIERARFRRADEIFDVLLEMEPSQRDAYLDQACGGDPVLRADLQRLLHAHDSTGSVLDASAASVAGPLLEATMPTADAMVSRYLLVRRLGRGGMGEVWLARDAQLDREVAIKIMRATIDAASDRAARVRALREARAIARLDHPNVAGIYDVGETVAGALWFAMPFCPGGSLADRLAGGPLPPDEVMHIGAQLARALAAAHAQGIVHRDVKPDNALIDAAGNIRLADFGIVKLSGSETEPTRGMIGTMAYVSPEQVCGEEVDARSDLWCLGVTLFELVSGHRPFSGASDAALLMAILHAPPAPLPADGDIPPALADVITQLLHKEPAQRPASASDVALALESAARPPRLRAPGGQGVTAPRGADALARDEMPLTRRVTRRVLVIGVLGLVVGGAGIWAWIHRPEPAARRAVVASDASVEASVAVLPFENTSRAAADEPFVDGLTEEVMSVLGRIPGLRVPSRTSTFALRGKGLGAREMAQTLGVDHLLEATVRREGDQLRVTARLVAADGSIRWSDDYDRQLRDVFRLQAEIATAIARELRPRLSAGAPYEATVQNGTSDLVAYDRFLDGRYQRAKRTPERLRLAVEQFRLALARDSLFGRAWGGLAQTYVMQTVFGGAPPRATIPRAREAALRAIALDSNTSDGNAALGHVNLVFDYDWQNALSRSERAIALDPTDELARVVHALSLFDVGRLPEARIALEQARARDVLSAGVLVTLGRVELEAGNIPASIALLQQTVALSPSLAYGHEQLGYAYLAARRNVDALASFRTAARITGARDSAHLAYALAATGDKPQARAVVAQLSLRPGMPGALSPLDLAVAYAGLGDADRTFALLERAWDDRSAQLDGIAVMPAFKGLVRDPRWQPYLTRMGLGVR